MKTFNNERSYISLSLKCSDKKLLNIQFLIQIILRNDRANHLFVIKIQNFRFLRVQFIFILCELKFEGNKKL